MTTPVAIDSSYQYPGVEITWAGECPLTGGLCFGTESGGVLIPFPDESGEAAWLVKDLGDVVNGLAFGDLYCAVSTPSRIGIIELATGEVAQFLPSGAHDIISLGNDWFLAPAGLGGLTSISVREGQVHVRELSPKGHEVYFYSATRLKSRSNEILIACAARHGGLIRATIPTTAEDVAIAAHLFPEIDIVGAIGLPGHDFPSGVVALGIDGSLLISRDILRERPSVIRFADMPGRAYSIRSVGSHLALLTPQALYLVRDFADLVPQLIEGSTASVRIAVAEIRASEIYVAFDRYLLAELDDGISAMDVNQIFTPGTEVPSNGSRKHTTAAHNLKRWSAEPNKGHGSIKSVGLTSLPSFAEFQMSATHF